MKESLTEIQTAKELHSSAACSKCRSRGTLFFGIRVMCPPMARSTMLALLLFLSVSVVLFCVLHGGRMQSQVMPAMELEKESPAVEREPVIGSMERDDFQLMVWVLSARHTDCGCCPYASSYLYGRRLHLIDGFTPSMQANNLCYNKNQRLLG